MIFRIVIVVCWAALVLVPHGVAAERPNFLVILCDDLGYGDLACYGHPTIRTPHLDQLAAGGLRLTDCYSAAPVCSSSRAGLLTGRTPSRTGVYDWIPEHHVMHLPPGEQTVATLLRDVGYATCHVGKWHLNGHFNSPEHPQPGDHGFDHWFATQNNAAPSHENPRNFVRNGHTVGSMEGFSCQLVADEAIRWLGDRYDADQPFFLFVCFHEPHEPVASPGELVEGYPEAETVDQAQYFANVTNLDRAVGRLVEALEDRNLTGETLVFFTSDNGPETLRRYPNANRSYGSPGELRGMKLHIYEGGIRVPGILSWPDQIAAGSESDVPVSSVDVLPTLCELAGIERPGDRTLDGTSVVPLLDGEGVERSDPLFWHYYRAISEPKVALRAGDWKVVAHWDGPSRPLGGNINAESQAAMQAARLTRLELYNLRNDPREEHDLAEQESDRLQALAAELKRRYRDVLDEGPTWEFPPE